MAGKRLANVKTRIETGFDYVISRIGLNTPFGKKQMKEMRPFFPGEEEGLRETLAEIDSMLLLAEERPGTVDYLMEVFMDMKDASFTIERSSSSTLSVVELFELKCLLLKMRRISELFSQVQGYIPKQFFLEDTEALLNALDPGKNRLATFYIYDEFSGSLAALRKEKREFEREIRRRQKTVKEAVREKYGISLTPGFEIVVSKSSDSQLAMIREIKELVQESEDSISVTFALKKTEEVYAILRKMETVSARIEEEETRIREQLSRTVSQYQEQLTINCQRIGKLDMALAKALYAKARACVRPEIVLEHILEIEDGRHLMVEDILLEKEKEYCPVSLRLGDGVTCITGANMGGKTVSLKLAGLVALLAQYGFFVPAACARVGLSNYMQLLIGDSQSVERGLSSFGSEMEELKEILDNSRGRSLLMIDEIAGGTNPVEGLALTRSLLDYLKTKPYISLITTHFDSVAMGGGVRNMQVKGLVNADFSLLDRELRYAGRKERIEIIGRYMDYRLVEVEREEEIPKDALNIARMLGIRDEIIERAKSYIK